MNRNIVYFNNNYDIYNKKGYVKQLEKKGYFLHKVSTLSALELVIEKYNPFLIITTDPNLVELISNFTEKPLLIVSDIPVKIDVKEVKNLLFFRTETEENETIIDTIKLVQIQSGEYV